jgi:hypothetical protein
VPLRQEAHSLLDYNGVVIRFTAGDSDSADRFPVALQGAAGRPDLTLGSPVRYAEARAQAEYLAQFLRLPLVDASTDHPAVSDWDEIRQGRAKRPAAGEEPPLDVMDFPQVWRSEVRLEGERVRIVIPGPGFGPGTLLGCAIPLGFLLLIGPQFLRFFGATGTPQYVSPCFSGFFLLFFIGLPLLGVLNTSLRARRGGTVVTASPAGITIEERGAWRSRTTSLPAADIVGLDYSTPATTLAAAQVSATRRAWRSGTGTGSTEIEGAGLPPAWTRWLAKVVKSKGVVVKSRQGLYTFGAGLPAAEVYYLWTVVRRALAGGL